MPSASRLTTWPASGFQLTQKGRSPTSWLLASSRSFIGISLQNYRQTESFGARRDIPAVGVFKG
jgi:hypothetical protein